MILKPITFWTVTVTEIGAEKTKKIWNIVFVSSLISECIC